MDSSSELPAIPPNAPDVRIDDELTPNEIEYLTSQKSHYFSTLKPLRKDVRASMVQHILDGRHIAPGTPFAASHFHGVCCQ